MKLSFSLILVFSAIIVAQEKTTCEVCVKTCLVNPTNSADSCVEGCVKNIRGCTRDVVNGDVSNRLNGLLIVPAAVAGIVALHN